MKNLKAIGVTAAAALSFVVVGLFLSAQDKTEQPLGYSYKIELVSLTATKDIELGQRLGALFQLRGSVMAMAYIPVPLKKTILIDLEEEIFDVKAAMARAKSARLGKNKPAKGGSENCEKCLSEKQGKKPEVRRFLEGQSWV